MALQAGDSFGGCRLLQLCGKGAYGTVYLAENAIGQRCALKLFDSQEAGERELRGIRNYMRLPPNTPALITIHHTGFENGKFYYIMDVADNVAMKSGEYLPDTLAQRLKGQGRLPEPEDGDALAAILEALQLDRRYPTFLGIAWRDGAWRCLSDNAPAKLAAGRPAPQPDSQKLFLSAGPTAPFFPTTSTSGRPSFVIEYPSQHALETRPRPACEITFEVKGRRFGLWKAYMPSLIQPAFLDFAGYRAPILSDPEVLRKVQEELQDMPGTIALGTRYFYGKWYWRDGTPVQLDSEPSWSANASNNVYPRSYAAIVLIHGNLYLDVNCDYLLVELEPTD